MINSLSDLEAFIKFCQLNGVKAFSVGNVSVSLGPSATKVVEIEKPVVVDEEAIRDQLKRELEETLYYSSGG